MAEKVTAEGKAMGTHLAFAAFTTPTVNAAAVRSAFDAAIAGLILVDNSVGEDPPPVGLPPRTGPQPPREARMRGFVRGMFRRPRPEAWLDRLTTDALRIPEPAAKMLLAYPAPRTYWKEALYSVRKPVLYIARPKFAGQAENVRAHHPTAEVLSLDSSLGHGVMGADVFRLSRELRAGDVQHRFPHRV